jgi:dTMP kinase
VSGLFLSFEGGEASGKSTQARLLADHLRSRGKAVVTTREPGGTKLGERVRDVVVGFRTSARYQADQAGNANLASDALLSVAGSTWRAVVAEPFDAGTHQAVSSAYEIPLISAEAEALLFNAARAELVEEVIRPSLEKGLVVITDRYFDSTLAYQGYGRGGDLPLLQAVCRFATTGVIPTRTFLIDLSVAIALKRLNKRDRQENSSDRFHGDQEGFHKRVRDGYLRLAAAEPGRFVVIDGDRPEDVVAADIRRQVDQLMGLTA